MFMHLQHLQHYIYSKKIYNWSALARVVRMHVGDVIKKITNHPNCCSNQLFLYKITVKLRITIDLNSYIIISLEGNANVLKLFVFQNFLVI